MALKHNRIIIGMIIIGNMMSMCSLHACLTTFINDKSARVIIYNKDDQTLILLGRNQKRRFGNQHKHAHFDIYVQQQNRPVLSRLYTCKQIKCGGNGNIQLKLSDIENGTEVTELFTIIKHGPHSPMVHELPIMQSRNI